MKTPRQPFSDAELEAIEVQRLRLRSCGAGLTETPVTLLDELIVTGAVYLGLKDIAAKAADMFRAMGQDDLAVRAEGIARL